MMTLPSPPATKTVEIDMVNALFLLSEMKKKKKWHKRSNKTGKVTPRTHKLSRSQFSFA